MIESQFAAGYVFIDGFASVRGWTNETAESDAPDLGLSRPQPLAIIDLTGRVIYQAPVAKSVPASDGPKSGAERSPLPRDPRLDATVDACG